jgi:hypothetical protein
LVLVISIPFLDFHAFAPSPTIQAFVVENPEAALVVICPGILGESKSTGDASVKFSPVFLEKLFESHLVLLI